MNQRKRRVFSSLATLLSLIFILSAFTIGCSKKSETSTLTMNFSDWNEIREAGIAQQGKVSSLAYDASTVGTVIINVSGSGINPPILKQWSRHNQTNQAGTAPTSFDIPDIPRGTGRLVQVLAVYEGSGLQFFYGEAKVDMSTDTTSADVTLTLQGGSQIQGDIIGRIVPLAEPGYTGRFQFRFRPPTGSQSMVVDNGEMYDGWTTLFALGSPLISYIAADGTSILPGATTTNDSLHSYLHPQKSMRVRKPAGYNNKSWTAGVFDFSDGIQSERVVNIGYFGPGAANQRVCFDSPASPGSAQPLEQVYSDNILPTPAPMYWYGNLTPSGPPFTNAFNETIATPSPFQGGSFSASCATGTEFVNYLNFRELKLAHSDSIVGFRGPFRYISEASGYYKFVDLTDSGSGNFQVTWQLLPGNVTAAINQNLTVFYRQITTGSSSDQDSLRGDSMSGFACSNFKKPEYGFSWIDANASSGSTTIGPVAAGPAITDSSKLQVVLCPKDRLGNYFSTGVMGWVDGGGGGGGANQVLVGQPGQTWDSTAHAWTGAGSAITQGASVTFPVVAVKSDMSVDTGYGDTASANPHLIGLSGSITSFTLSGGLGSLTVTFSSNGAGQIETGGANGLIVSDMSVTVNSAAAAPDNLTIAGNTSVLSGSCQAYTVVSQSGPTPTNVGTGTTVTLTDATAAGGFYSDSGCSTSISSVTITSGTSSAGFYYRDNTAETAVLTASAAGLTSGSNAITIGPNHLLLTGATSIRAGLCNAYTVTAKDAGGTIAPVPAAVTVDLSYGATAERFYSDSGCTSMVTQTSIAAGASSATFYLLDATSESVTIMATDTTSVMLGDSMGIAVGPDRLLLTGPNQFNSGQCVQFTATASDVWGLPKNVFSATTVSLSDGAAGGATYSDNACSTPVFSVAIAGAGNSVNFYYKDNTAESGTISITDGGSVLTGASMAFATRPNQLIITGATTFNSGTCTAYTITSKGADGVTAALLNPITVNLLDGIAAGIFYSDISCSAAITQTTMSASTSSATVYYKDSVAETISLAAQESTSLMLAPALSVSTGPDHIVVALASTFQSGTCQAVSVTLKDQSGSVANALSAVTVSLADGAAAGSYYSDAVCSSSITTTSIGVGASSKTVYYKDSTAESVTLSASDVGASIGTGTSAATAGPDRFVVTGPNPIKSGTCASFTVSAKDAAGSVANVFGTTTINLSDGAAAGTFYSDVACSSAVASVTMSGGTSAKTFYYKDLAAEPITLMASDAASVLSNGTLSTASGPDHFVIAGNQNFVHNRCASFSITSLAANGSTAGVLSNTTINLTDGAAAGSFYSDNTCSTGTTSVSMSTSANVATVYYKDGNIEPAPLTAADNAANLASGTLGVNSLPDGYFVLSSATFTGNLGGLAGADSSCFNDLNGNPWLGKSTLPTALSTPQVHAFLCTTSTCNNLQPARQYAFAASGNVTAGGAMFSTDVSGAGPGDALQWSPTTYFGISVQYFTGRPAGVASTWATTPGASTCTDWTDGTSGSFGTVGVPANTTSARWNSSTATCSAPQKIICVVDL